MIVMPSPSPAPYTVIPLVIVPTLLSKVIMFVFDITPFVIAVASSFKPDSSANSKVSKCSVVASSYTRKSLASDESLSVPSKIIEPSTTEIKPAGKETFDSELANTNGSPIL